MIDIFSAFGLSASAGLNAYLPLFIVALTGRFFPRLLTLNEPYDALTSWWAIGVLGVLLVVEIFVDKIPAVDTINDVINTAIRPVAGALLFAASTNAVSGIDPILAVIAGLLVSGGVHVAKTTARPVVTATTAGIGNPVISTVEDIAAFVTSILAILMPVLVGLVLIMVVVLYVWWRVRRARRRAAA
jgi:hypothetical protein